MSKNKLLSLSLGLTATKSNFSLKIQEGSFARHGGISVPKMIYRPQHGIGGIIIFRDVITSGIIGQVTSGPICLVENIVRHFISSLNQRVGRIFLI